MVPQVPGGSKCSKGDVLDGVPMLLSGENLWNRSRTTPLELLELLERLEPAFRVLPPKPRDFRCLGWRCRFGGRFRSRRLAEDGVGHLIARRVGGGRDALHLELELVHVR